MRLLKKASYRDIIDEHNSGRMNKSAVLAHYKEFELYLSQKDLENLLAEDENGKNGECQKLIKSLRESKAVITAIHCPESRFVTINDKKASTNYVSFCEILNDKESKDCFFRCIELADKINREQYEDKKHAMIVVIHDGCRIGCQGKEEGKCERAEQNQIEEEQIKIFVEEVKKKAAQIKTQIIVAIENITPFYREYGKDEGPFGKNCGWKYDNQIIRKKIDGRKLLDYLNENKKEQEQNSKKITFGICVDFCHIIAAYKLTANEKMCKESTGFCLCSEDGDINNEKLLCDQIEAYFSKLGEDIKDIKLFHVSNLGRNGEHGEVFSFSEEDSLAGVIRNCCEKYGKKAPITLEMKGGMDRETANRNFNQAMYAFSKKHSYGRLKDLLDGTGNRDLKKFFDDLFYIYSSPVDYTYEISKKIIEVKEFVYRNSHQKLEWKTIFGFHEDEQERSTALLRLQAYIYYARFTNLAHYLAENYYQKKNYIFLSEEDAKEDFGLAMKYFMFNDIWNQCVYTGVAYQFLINFLPRKENFYRFYDGIYQLTELEESVNGADHVEIFKQIVEKMRVHVDGDWDKIDNGKRYFYSGGKNFGNCLFKYGKEHREKGENDNENQNKICWVRIYKNLPINYVKIKRNKKERIYSIQAFLQKEKEETEQLKGISLDLSLFFNGRDKGDKKDIEDTSCLNGFVKLLTDKYEDKDESKGKGLVLEKAGCIMDGEILFTELPESGEEVQEYDLMEERAFVLRKMYRDWVKNGRNKEHMKYQLKEGDPGELTDVIEKITKIKAVIENEEEMEKLRRIIETVPDEEKNKNRNNNTIEFEGNNKKCEELLESSKTGEGNEQ